MPSGSPRVNRRKRAPTLFFQVIEEILMPDRDFLLKLIDSIRVAQDHGDDSCDGLRRFNELLPNTDIENLCHSDYSDDTIVDICLGEQATNRQLTREELMHLVDEILHSPATTEAEDVLRVLAFKANCIHPDSSDLLFFPARQMTVEEIVDLALNGDLSTRQTKQNGSV